MKIYITGSSGSGKSTYAKKLGEELNLPIYQTDHFYNEGLKRMFLVDEIKEVVPIDGDWIIEGAYYIPEYILAADKVIYLRISVAKTVYRIWKRWLGDRELRAKFGFMSTLKLSYTTVKDLLTSEGIETDTKLALHYKEKDRYRLCKANAREFVEIKN